LYVNLLRSPGIDSQPGGKDTSESISGLLKHLQYGLCPEIDSKESLPQAYVASVRIHKLLRNPGIDSFSSADTHPYITGYCTAVYASQYFGTNETGGIFYASLTFIAVTFPTNLPLFFKYVSF
jgi:hypothetical protein